MIVIVVLWQQSQQAYFRGATAAELQQNARVALEQMTREIRQAGYDPCRYIGVAGTCATTSAFDPVTAGVFPIQTSHAPPASGYARTGIANGDVTPGGTNPPEENVCFRFAGGQILRKTTGVDCTSGGVELARNITGLTFTYRKADGTAATLADGSDIRLIRTRHHRTGDVHGRAGHRDLALERPAPRPIAHVEAKGRTSMRHDSRRDFAMADEQGTVLVVTVVAMLILGILAVSFAALANLEVRIGLNDVWDKQAALVAEGGLGAVRNQLQNPSDYSRLPRARLQLHDVSPAPVQAGLRDHAPRDDAARASSRSGSTTIRATPAARLPTRTSGSCSPRSELRGGRPAT